MSTHEWDTRVAQGRATDLIHTLEHEINRLRDRIVALEFELIVRDDLIDSVTAERDRAVDRCVARIITDGTPGPGRVTLHGHAHAWRPGPNGLEEDDIAGLA